MAGNTDTGSGRRESRWRIAVWGTAALILLLPLLAMQFTDEVAWDLVDFATFGAELAARVTSNSAYRAGAELAHPRRHNDHVLLVGINSL